MAACFRAAPEVLPALCSRPSHSTDPSPGGSAPCSGLRANGTASCVHPQRRARQPGLGRPLRYQLATLEVAGLPELTPSPCKLG